MGSEERLDPGGPAAPEKLPEKLPELPTARRLRYAAMLRWGAWAGLGLLVVAFALYAGGVVEPAVPLDELPRYWHLSIAEHHRATAPYERIVPTEGWRWVAHLDRGESLAQLPVVFLASLTIICYLFLLPAFTKKGERALLALIIVQLLVLVLAASGVVGGL
jgi:hypothetical protein